MVTASSAGFEPVAAFLAGMSALGLAWTVTRLRLVHRPAASDRRRSLRRARLMVTVPTLLLMVVGFSLNAVAIWRFDGILNAILVPMLLAIGGIAIVEVWAMRRVDGDATSPPGSASAALPPPPGPPQVEAAAARFDAGLAEDPGWLSAPGWILLGPLLMLLLPVIVKRRSPSLLELRSLFLGSLLTLACMLAVLPPVLGHAPSEPRPGWPLLLVAAFIVYAAALGRWIWRRPLPEGDAVAFANAYRARMFVGIALTSSIAMMGFTGSFIVDDWRLYAVALLPSLIGYVLIAPTRASLERIRDDLRARGSRIDPFIALNTTPTVRPTASGSE